MSHQLAKMHRIQFRLRLRPAEPHLGKLHMHSSWIVVDTWRGKRGKKRREEKEGCKSIPYFLAKSDANGFGILLCYVLLLLHGELSRLQYSRFYNDSMCMWRRLLIGILPVVVWRSDRALVSINEVNLLRDRLVLGWVTVSWFSSRC